VVLGVSQAVPGISGEPAVADFGVKGYCLAAKRAGLLVVAKEAVVEADRVERCGLVCLVADVLVQAQRLLGVPERVGVAALTFGQHAEIHVDLGLAEAVAEPPVQRETAGEVVTGLIMVAEVGARVCQAAAGEGLRGGVAQAGRGGQRRALNRGPFLPVPAGMQEGIHGPRELPCVSVEPGSGGEGHGGEQDLALLLEPGQSLPVIGGLPGSGAGPGWGEGGSLPGWDQQAGGAGGGVQVVVEDPAGGLASVGVAVGVAGLLGGVSAQQVVEGVPARDMLGDQVRARQLAQQASRVGFA
jgi:hypothetical protein